MHKSLLLPLFLATSLLVSGCSSIIKATTDEPMQEHPGERTWGQAIDDSSIETYSYVNLSKLDPALDDQRIIVTSHNGVVLLVGQVSSVELKQKAEEAIRLQRRVRKVHNELQVSGPIGVPARSADGWIATKIRTKMMASKEVPSDRIQVVTENGVVYLLGRVKPAEAQQAVDVVRNTYGVQKVVKVFEYI